jgi:hypothetical protein
MTTPPTDKEIEAAKAKAGSVALYQVEVDLDGETYYSVNRVPTKAEWIKFLDESSNDSTDIRLKAQENLVYVTALWPDREVIKTAFAAKVGLPANFAAEVGKHAGLGAASRSKKL